METVLHQSYTPTQREYYMSENIKQIRALYLEISSTSPNYEVLSKFFLTPTTMEYINQPNASMKLRLFFSNCVGTLIHLHETQAMFGEKVIDTLANFKDVNIQSPDYDLLLDDLINLTGGIPEGVK